MFEQPVEAQFDHAIIHFVVGTLPDTQCLKGVCGFFGGRPVESPGSITVLGFDHPFHCIFTHLPIVPMTEDDRVRCGIVGRGMPLVEPCIRVFTGGSKKL